MLRKLASKDNFNLLIEEIASQPQISLDCEATGLFPYLGDRLFSIIIGTENASYYFNYNNVLDHFGDSIDSRYILERGTIKEILKNFHGEIFLHNAKYDMHLLHFEGLELTDFDIHCTQALGRVEKNNRLNYSLDSLAKEIGFPKDDIKAYCNKNRLYTWLIKPGGQKYKKYHYEKVPFDMMVSYGHRDAEITYKLGVHQKKELERLDRQFGERKYRVSYVAENEKRLTKTLYRMEQAGCSLNHSYVERALQFEEENLDNAKTDWRAATGLDFKDSNKLFAEAFTRAGIPFPTTAKGNPSFRKEVLDEIDNDLARIIKRHRTAEKTIQYYRNFIFLESDEGRIHANAKQGGAETGRMSYSEPNLQNLTKIEKDDPRYNDPFHVRGCIQPTPGNILVMMDFDQQEYRLMLDYAGEEELIKKILNGLDVHVATGEMMETPRKEAKTLNFMLLYGGGIAKLCLAICNPKLQELDLKILARLYFQEEWPIPKIKRFLGKEFKLGKEKFILNATPEQVDHDILELKKAKAKKDLYNKKIPSVSKFVKGVTKAAKDRGFVFNWAGRICNATRGFEWILPNHIIQGGCGDVVKIAMNRIDQLLLDRKAKTKMIIQVHDELVFEMDPDELYLLDEIKSIMEGVYEFNHLPLTVGVEYSTTSWQFKEEWDVTKTRDYIQSLGLQENRQANEHMVRVDRSASYQGYSR